MRLTPLTMTVRPARIAVAMSISAIAALAVQPASADGDVVHATNIAVDSGSALPHVLDNPAADALVQIYGEVCAGTPIKGTVFVVTAAHCVLTDGGDVTRRTIVRDGIRYPAVRVLVDTRYVDHPSEAFDAAVLVMAQMIPGPSARLGSALPNGGQVTLAGYQPTDGHGTLLRGGDPDDQLLSNSSADTTTESPLQPAGCVVPISAVHVSATRVVVRCGLVPGASGGGLFTEQHGEAVLVGILSTVTADLTTNGVVPLASLHELLEHPDRYAHPSSNENTRRSYGSTPDAYAQWLPTEDARRSQSLNALTSMATRSPGDGDRPRRQWRLATSGLGGAGYVGNRVSVRHVPSVVIDGGTPERRHTVIDAVNRYVSVGLALPDLRVHIHTGGKTGCSGFQGLYHLDGDVAVIDLCYPGEFLVLHELGHAWDRFNLDDHRRADFERLTGLTTWRSTDVAWHDRAAERAANVLAHGLLSTPLATARYHELDFELFEALTGITSPRLAEIEPAGTRPVAVDHEQLTRLAEYERWRAARRQDSV